VKKVRNLQDLESLRKSILQEKYSEKPCIIISEKSTCCYLSGSKEVVEAFRDGLKNFDLENQIDIKSTGCFFASSITSNFSFSNSLGTPI